MKIKNIRTVCKFQTFPRLPALVPCTKFVNSKRSRAFPRGLSELFLYKVVNWVKFTFLRARIMKLVFYWSDLANFLFVPEHLREVPSSLTTSMHFFFLKSNTYTSSHVLQLKSLHFQCFLLRLLHLAMCTYVLDELLMKDSSARSLFVMRTDQNESS